MHNAMAHHIDIGRTLKHLRIAVPKQFKRWFQHRHRRVNTQLALDRCTVRPSDLNFGNAGVMAPVGMRGPTRLRRGNRKRTLR